MKTLTFLTATGLLAAMATPVMAQSTPTSNATNLGTETTQGSSSGMLSAGNPVGQLSTTSTGPGAPTAPNASMNTGNPAGSSLSGGNASK